MKGTKGGRPRRWDPANVKTLRAKVPLELAVAFEAEAARRGMTMQDFLGNLAAEVTGVPYDPQGGLPLSA